MNENDTTGEVLDWADAKRAAIVATARGELGDQAKGSRRVYEYAREVLPQTWTDAQVKQFAGEREWCGVFALWCYRQNGIGLGVNWISGSGFAQSAWIITPGDGLPKPGDLCIRPKNGAGKFVWHHAIVASYATGGELVTVDGNQPGVLVRRRPVPRDNMIYYSIDSLLTRALGPGVT